MPILQGYQSVIKNTSVSELGRLLSQTSDIADAGERLSAEMTWRKRDQTALSFVVNAANGPPRLGVANNIMNL